MAALSPDDAVYFSILFVSIINVCPFNLTSLSITMNEVNAPATRSWRADSEFFLNIEFFDVSYNWIYFYRKTF